MPLFRGLPQADVVVVRQMIAERVNTPLAHGLGRYFDALGALVMNRRESRYEGQTALEWNLIADPDEHECYPFVVDTLSTPWTLDLRPLVREAVSDLTSRLPAAGISAKFHNTVIAATAALVRAAAGRVGRVPVVLTGGCFQNARLAEGVHAALSSDYTVYLHRQVPPGDGGIALGQALVADALARRRRGGESQTGPGETRPFVASSAGGGTCA
jgi:hydrogenase maturation protein HypF